MSRLDYFSQQIEADSQQLVESEFVGAQALDYTDRAESEHGTAR